jgi:hypothetical protein
MFAAAGLNPVVHFIRGEWHTFVLEVLRILCKLGMCIIVANIMERCSLFLPGRGVDALA